jgi:hypothetical protein
MKNYIGTRLVRMLVMTRQEYNNFRGWELPADENGADEGYLVEYQDGDKPNTPQFAGYVSWLPKEQADRAYRLTEALPFGLALEALKLGSRITRAGWNGRGMWLILVPGTAKAITAEGSAYFKAGVTETEILPRIDMWTTNAQGRRAILPGWLASQTDMLSDDWSIV